jgi:thioredoxin-dependent peroxiredoxin
MAAKKKTKKKGTKKKSPAKRKAAARKAPPKKAVAKKAAPAKGPLIKGPKVGDRAPDFTMPTDGTGTVTLSALRGKPVVLYFYPRDDTPGCTMEACGFNDNLPNFSSLNAEIVGVSKDNEASHARFRAKFGLKFHLAADTDTKVAKAYGVWIEKSLYGRKYMGMDRATYLIDKDGIIRGVWRSVKVPGHVDAVLEAAQAL